MARRWPKKARGRPAAWVAAPNHYTADVMSADS